jgi:DNA-binding IclR family transcriptional regulator
MTENTVVNQKRLREILAGVRQDGYAINDEELELGCVRSRCRCAALPARCWPR